MSGQRTNWRDWSLENSQPREIPWEHASPMYQLPEDVLEPLVQFLLDKRTGNVSLNIKDGQVMGLRVEEIVKITR